MTNPFINEISELQIDPNDYVIPVLPPAPKDVRGYLYLLKDSAFSNFIKIGRTINAAKRLSGYNSNRPIATAYFIYISELFVDAVYVERVILKTMYNEHAVVGKTKEWFNIDKEEILFNYIKQAEEHLAA